MVDTVAEVAKNLPMKHKVAKVVIASVAGFLAKDLAEKAYMAAYTCIKDKKVTT